MISGTGTWYDGKTSEPHNIRIRCEQGLVTVTGEGIAVSNPVCMLKIDTRLGRALRRIRFPGGEIVESCDQILLDQLQEEHEKRGFFGMVYRWQTNLGWLLWSVVILLGLTFFFSRYGIPALSTHASSVFPVSAKT